MDDFVTTGSDRIGHGLYIPMSLVVHSLIHPPIIPSFKSQNDDAIGELRTKMAPPAGLALQRQLQAPEAGAASSKVVTALWVLGLFTASVAITLAAREPPLPPVPGLRKNAYLLALSVAFFAGVAGVMAAVRIGWPTTPVAGRRRATGRKLVYFAAVVAVGGLMVVVSLLW